MEKSIDATGLEEVRERAVAAILASSAICSEREALNAAYDAGSEAEMELCCADICVYCRNVAGIRKPAELIEGQWEHPLQAHPNMTIACQAAAIRERWAGKRAASPQAPAPPAQEVTDEATFRANLWDTYRQNLTKFGYAFGSVASQIEFFRELSKYREWLSAAPGASPGLERIAQEIANSVIGPLLHARESGTITTNFLDEVKIETLAILSRSLEGRGGEPLKPHDYWPEYNKAVGELDALRRERQQLRMILDLVATDELFVQPAEGSGWVFWVNVNDMFYPAADGEGIDMAEIPAVHQAWKDKGWPGVVRWVQEKRGGLKLRKSREEKILTIESLQSQAAQLEAALRSLVEWDKRYPRNSYRIVEYGAVQQSEKELDSICTAAEAALGPVAQESTE